MNTLSGVHESIGKSNRQLYAVRICDGHGYSFKAWSTSRAVTRVPRVRGGGVHKSGYDDLVTGFQDRKSVV